MSKSLKNFITIDDALQKYSARQLRFAFLLQNWNARLDFKESSMQEVRGAESLLNVRPRLSSLSLSRCGESAADASGCRARAQNFFALVKALAAEAKEQSVASDGQHHYEQAEKDLLAKCVCLSTPLSHALAPS